MWELSAESGQKIIVSLFNIVLLPVLAIIVTFIVEIILEKLRYLQRKSVKLIGEWKDKKGFSYSLTAYLFLEPCLDRREDRIVRGFIEWELVAAPSSFFEKFPGLPISSKGFEIVCGRLNRKWVLHLDTEFTSDPNLISSNVYTITLVKRRRFFARRNRFEGNSVEIGKVERGECSGEAIVR